MQNKKPSIGGGGGGYGYFLELHIPNMWEIMVMQNSTFIGLNETTVVHK